MLRTLRKNYRRLVAFMLTAAMTFTNVGTSMNVAFAAGEEQEALFLVDGTDLREAIDSAVESGEAFAFSSLELKAKTRSLKTSYEKLLGGKNGKVYPLDVDVDERYAPEDTSVELFYNAGTEDVIFLFINEGDMIVRFRANVDGCETARVTINPNTANVDDTEASYVEDYSNTTMIDDMPHTLGAEVLNPTTEANADEGTEAEAEETSEASEETGDEAPTASEEAGTEETTGVGEAVESTEAAVNPGGTLAEETTEAAGLEETPAEGTAEAAGPEETPAEGSTEAAGPEETLAEGSAEAAGPEETPAGETSEAAEEGQEVKAEVREDAAVPEPEAVENGSEADEAGQETVSHDGTAVASISIRKLQQVASGVQVLDNADIAIESQEVPMDEETETHEDSDVEVETEPEASAESEDEAEETSEAETEATQAVETEEAATEAVDTDGTDADDMEESSPAQENQEDGEPGDASEEEPGEAAGDESSEADITVEESTPADEAGVPESPAETKADDQEDSISTTPDFGEGQELEDDVNNTILSLGTLEGKAYNTVTIWGSANARAYKVAAKDLAGMEAAAGVYRVDYTVNPVGTADIKGSSSIGEGENLYFAVVPQVGFAISTVTANGAELGAVEAGTVASEAESLAEYEFVYVVEDVTEDLEIVASLEEIEGMTHPEFSPAPVTRDGVTITVHAEEGIIPAGTKLQVTEVTSQLKDAITEKLESEHDAMVQEVIAYDINLVLDGKKLDNSWSQNGCVDVTFSGSRIRSLTEDADKVSFYAVDDSKAAPLSAKTAEGVSAEELKLEAEGQTDVKNTSVSMVSFEAEHFSIYAIAAEDESTPAVVRAFLQAVAGIPAITLDNAKEVSEYLFGAVADAYDALAGTEYMERKDVKEAEAVLFKAVEDVNAMLGIGSSMYATNISVYDHTLSEVKAAFRNQGILQITGDDVNRGTEARETLHVGETDSVPFVPVNGWQCRYCGYIFGGGYFAPMKYCETRGNELESKDLVVTSFGKTSTYNYLVGNTECLRMDIKGVKPGISSIAVSYYCNFEMYVSGFPGDNQLITGKNCISCFMPIVGMRNDATWHKYTHTVPVTVNADYQLIYDTQGGTSVSSTKVTRAAASAALTVTSVIPKREGYTFKGWAYDPEGKQPASSPVTLTWEKGYGSIDNPVSRTLYAIWEKGTTYTVVCEYYTNGIKAAQITGASQTGNIGDQITGAELAAANPQWKNYTIDGKTLTFTYESCSPTPSLTLTADSEGNVITLKYIRNDAPAIDKLAISKSLTSEKDTFIVGDEVGYIINVKNGNSQAVTVTVTDQLPEGLEFARFSQSDGGQYDKASHTATWENVSVPANGSKNLHIWVKAARTGRIVNTAAVRLGSGNTAPSRDSNQVVIQVQLPDLTPQTVNREVRGPKESADDSAVRVYCQTLRTGETDKFMHQVGYFDCYNLENGNEVHTDRIQIGQARYDASVGYICEVTFLAEKYTLAYNKLKGTTSPANKHTLVAGEGDKTVSFCWDSAKKEWKLKAGTDTPIKFYVKCPKPSLNGISKELVSINGTKVSDMDGNFSVKAGETVVLRYRITITGQKNAQYTVTDEGVELEAGSSWSGTLDSSGKAEIYVTKTVTAETAGSLKVSNTAYVKPGDKTDPITPADPDKDPTDPEKGYPSGTVETEIQVTGPSSKDALYTVHWYDAETGQTICKSESRSAAIGATVSVTDGDKTVNGYNYDVQNRNNVEQAVLAKAGTELKLYFTKRADLTYTVEYVDQEGNAVAESRTCDRQIFGTTVTENAISVDGYRLADGQQSVQSIVITAGKNLITFVYTRRTDLTYTVEHIDEDTGKVLMTSEAKAAFFGDVISGAGERVSISGYTFVRADDLTIGISNDKNIVRVYYSTDILSDPDVDPGLNPDPENQGDGIPDKYQITFTYKAGEHGSVTGITSEVKTIQTVIRDSGTGAITEVSPVKAANPTQPATVTPDSGYYFEKWNDGSADLADDDAVRAGSYITDVTFWAYFRDIPNNAMTAVKQVTNLPESGYFQEGEEARFVITVTNTGNRTLKNVKVRETLAGAVITPAPDGRYDLVNGDAVIAELPEGRSVTVEATYKITDTDLRNGSFSNTVVVSAVIDSSEPEAHPVRDITAESEKISVSTPDEGNDDNTGDTDDGNDNNNGTDDGNGGNGGGSGGGSGGGTGGSGGSGGGSGSGGSSGGSTSSGGTITAGGGNHAGGPGVPAVTIDPGAVPLAELPGMSDDDFLAVIDDEDVPLAALPKTGQTESPALMLMLSSMMLAAFMLGSRKKDEQ